jgi:hypothetical protein
MQAVNGAISIGGEAERNDGATDSRTIAVVVRKLDWTKYKGCRRKVTYENLIISRRVKQGYLGGHAPARNTFCRHQGRCCACKDAGFR